MASLVLGVAGAFVGSYFGPLGASLGWSVGSALGTILDPQKTEGPRLNDLKVQASQYGQPIPIPYGRVRVAGNVIFATDLHEHSHTSSVGKGGPQVTEYTYTCSFAVLICVGPIVAVPRIWADGRLVHDTFNYASQTSFPHKLYLGTETQLPDPTMEAELGVGNVPAHRGYAYIVFDELDLTDYGNRIPNLEFEVMTEALETTPLRILIQTEQTHEYNWSWFGGNGGIGEPHIIQWPTTVGDEVIKVKVMGLPIAPITGVGLLNKYDPETLQFIDYDAYPGPGHLPPTIAVPGISGPTHFLLYTIGGVYIHGALTYLYVYQFALNGGIPISTLPRQNPPITDWRVWSPDGTTLWCGKDYLATPGIPIGSYIYGLYFTQDKSCFFVFYNETVGGPGNEPDKWACIEDEVIVDSGTIGANWGGSPWLGFGSGGWGNTTVGMFENNREWLWIHDGGGGGDNAHVWHIDQDTKELAYYAPCAAVQLDNSDGILFPHPAIYVIRDGYMGVISGASFAIITRFPLYDPIGIPLDEVVADLCERAGLTSQQYDVTSLADDIVPGFLIAVRGDIRASLSQLQVAYFFDAVESERKMKFVKRGTVTPVTISSDDLIASDPEEKPPPELKTTRKAETELPAKINITYWEYETDYQPGTQQGVRMSTDSEDEQTIELPIVMEPMQAKQVADLNLFNAWMEREQFEIRLPRRHAHYEPTDVFIVNDRELRVAKKIELPNGAIEYIGVRSNNALWVHLAAGISALGHATPRSGSGGGNNPEQADLLLLDIPLLNDSDEQPGLYVAMAGTESTSFPGAELYRSQDDVTFTRIGSHARADTIGTADTVLGNFYGGNIFDELNSVDVTLGDGVSGTLDSKSATLVLNGANKALLGDEIIQFKNAVLFTGSPLATSHYRLSGLLRGRHGTEWAMSTHRVLERFVLLPTTDYSAGLGDVGVEEYYRAVMRGNSLANVTSIPFILQSIRQKPLSPVHLHGYADGTGDATLKWMRRSRFASSWVSFIDAPLAEANETYTLEIFNSTYTLCARTIVVSAAQQYVYTSAMQVADFGVNQQNIFFAVAQVGALGNGYVAQGSVRGLGVVNGSPLVPVTSQLLLEVSYDNTVDGRHLANFATLFDSDRRSAYYYATFGLLQNIEWYDRYKGYITATFFNNDTWALRMWEADAEGYQAYFSDWETINDLALAAAGYN
jgi:hypothetical protein